MHDLFNELDFIFMNFRSSSHQDWFATWRSVDPRSFFSLFKTSCSCYRASLHPHLMIIVVEIVTQTKKKKKKKKKKAFKITARKVCSINHKHPTTSVNRKSF